MAFFQNPTRNVSWSKIGHNFRMWSGSKIGSRKNVFTKKWSLKFVWFLTLKIDFEVENLLYFEVTILAFFDNWSLKIFPLSLLILGQKSCFLGPNIFKIPQPNWYYCVINMHARLVHRYSVLPILRTYLLTFKFKNVRHVY